jgi:hypothetical protein
MNEPKTALCLKLLIWKIAAPPSQGCGEGSTVHSSVYSVNSVYRVLDSVLEAWGYSTHSYGADFGGD